MIKQRNQADKGAWMHFGPWARGSVSCVTIRKMVAGLVVTFDVQLFAGGAPPPLCATGIYDV